MPNGTNGTITREIPTNPSQGITDYMIVKSIRIIHKSLESHSVSNLTIHLLNFDRRKGEHIVGEHSHNCSPSLKKSTLKVCAAQTRDTSPQLFSFQHML